MLPFLKTKLLRVLGIIVRDNEDRFVVGHTVHSPSAPAAKEPETLCLLDALQWIQSLHMENVIFESDAKTLVDVIHSNKSNIFEFSALVDDCKVILQIKQTFKVCFVKRQANTIANVLAKTACSYADPSIWNFSPSFINVLLLEDLRTSFMNYI